MVVVAAAALLVAPCHLLSDALVTSTLIPRRLAASEAKLGAYSLIICFAGNAVASSFVDSLLLLLLLVAVFSLPLQEAGEALFVPSGWHHTVANLEDTLSINHNWLNAHNVHWAWALLAQQHREAAGAIEDCRWANAVCMHACICGVRWRWMGGWLDGCEGG